MVPSESRLQCMAGVLLVPAGFYLYGLTNFAPVWCVLTFVGVVLVRVSLRRLRREAPFAATLAHVWQLAVTGLLITSILTATHRCPIGAFAGLEHMPFMLTYLAVFFVTLAATPVLLGWILLERSA